MPHHGTGGGEPSAHLAGPLAGRDSRSKGGSRNPRGKTATHVPNAKNVTKRLLRTARRLLIATTTAAAVVLIGTRINPPGVDIAAGPDVEPVLREVVADTWVDVSNFARAAASLSRASRVPVTIDSNALESIGYDARPDADPPDPASAPNRIRVRNAPLARAVADVIRAVAGDRAGLAPSFRVAPDGGSIVIGPRQDDGRPWSPRAYDVADLAADCRRWPDPRTAILTAARAPDGALDGYAGVMLFLDDALWDGSWDVPARYDRGRLGSRAWFVAPPGVQWDVQRILFLMRHPRGAEGAR